MAVTQLRPYTKSFINYKRQIPIMRKKSQKNSKTREVALLQVYPRNMQGRSREGIACHR